MVSHMITCRFGCWLCLEGAGWDPLDGANGIHFAVPIGSTWRFCWCAAIETELAASQAAYEAELAAKREAERELQDMSKMMRQVESALEQERRLVAQIGDKSAAQARALDAARTEQAWMALSVAQLEDALRSERETSAKANELTEVLKQELEERTASLAEQVAMVQKLGQESATLRADKAKMRCAKQVAPRLVLAAAMAL